MSDSANAAARSHRRPRRFDYNLIVIGAGSAGLVASYIAATINARVLLIEKHRMGGDCLNTGCVPSKSLLRTARLLAEARESSHYGVREMKVDFDFAEAMERVQDVISKIEPHDSVERYTSLGVEVMKGEAQIVTPWEVEVDGKRLSAREIVLATGASPLVPDIEGLDTVEFLTSDTVWSLRELPRRLVVLGGGPIGCELTQCFARMGSEVTQVEKSPRLLSREDQDASAAVSARFEREGVRIAVDHEAVRARSSASGKGGVLVCKHEGREIEFEFDVLLVALGRRANIKGFGLEQLGVAIEDKGTVAIDDFTRTSVPSIRACGDVAGPYQFTHFASHQAWYAAVNALIAPFWRFKADYSVIPWTTFTEPEVARVGLSEDEARDQGIAIEVTRYGIDELDRAIADGAATGYVKVLTEPGRDRILGVCIVGAHAGELLAEFVLAMKHGIGLNKILGTIHVYPTMAEANKYVAGNWKRAHAPQHLLEWARRFFRWRRG